MKVNWKKWCKVTSKLDRHKYHLCTKFGDTGFVEEYAVYKKDMPYELYISKDNKAILSTENGNTFEDLKKFIKENDEKRKENIRDVVLLIIWMSALLIVLIDNIALKFIILAVEWIFLFIDAMLIRREYNGNR